MHIGTRVAARAPLPPPSVINVEAHGQTDDNGDIIGLTYMRIADSADDSKAVEQSFPADVQVNVAALQLPAFPGRHYDIDVAWADSSKYAGSADYVDGGNYLTVDSPS